MARMNQQKYRKMRHQARLIVADIGASMMLKAQGHQCPICQERLSPSDITVDHVYPLHWCCQNGGNLLLSHYKCNQIKGERDPTDFEIQMLERVNDSLGYDFKMDRYRCRQVLVNKYYKVALWFNELRERGASQHDLDKVQLKLFALEDRIGRWIDK